MLTSVLTLYLVACADAFSFGRSANYDPPFTANLHHDSIGDDSGELVYDKMVKFYDEDNLLKKISKYADSSTYLLNDHQNLAVSDVKCTAVADPAAMNFLQRIWRWFRPAYLYNSYSWIESEKHYPENAPWWSAWEPASECMVSDGSGNGPNHDNYAIYWAFACNPSTPDGENMNWNAIYSPGVPPRGSPSVWEDEHECAVPDGEVAQLWAQCLYIAVDYRTRKCNAENGKVSCEEYSPYQRADFPHISGKENIRLGCSVGKSKVQCSA